jgi:S1-C subfamily serine protease
VVAGTTKVAATIASNGDTYVATVLGFDQTRDVALLQLKDASGLATVTLDQDSVNVGDAVAAVGNANGGMKLVKATGSVTGTNQPLTVSSDSPWGNSEDLQGLVATSAGAVPGDSGGPMFDAQNEVLGMTTAGSTKEHSSYAIPIATAVGIVNQIETGQDAGTVRVGPAGYLGVRVADASYTGVGGATVESVVTNGPADKAGITAGSRLTRIGSTTITAQTNVANVIRQIEPGQQVTIWWITAKGTTKHAQVTAGASPVN